MNAKHTPGPWHLGVRQAEPIVYNSEGWAVANAVVYHGQSDMEECKANARVIAAAPELLALVEEAATVHDRAEWLKRANDAIARAKGE